MRHSIKRISKSALSVILALMMVVSTMVVGMVTVNALNVQAGAILFFDNSKTNWTGNIYFSVGTDSASRYDKMTKVPYSNIYYLNVGTKYDNASYFAFFSSSESNLTGESTGYSGLASKGSYTGSCGSYDFNSGSCYVITPSGSSNGSTITPSYQSSGYGYFNSKKQTLTMQLQDGDTVTTLTDDSKAVATMKVATYKMTSNTATEAVSSESKSASIADVAAMYTAETTLSYSNLDSGYEFVGWYNSDGTQVGTNTTYTYSASSASSTTYYARFKAASTTETNWYIYGAKWSDSWNNPTTKGQQLSLVDGYTSLYSVTLSGTYLTDYFNFHDGTNQYIPDSGSESTLNNGSTNKTKIKTGNNVSFKNSSQSSDNVTVYLDASDSSNIYVWYEPAIKKLANPTISFDSTTIAAADNSYVTLTVDNHSYYTSLSDVTVTYKLFNGDSEVTTASFDSNGKCQISEAGTYKVQAVSSDTSKYTNSEYSTATTITKAAAPEYYVSGRFRVKVNDEYVSIKGSYGWSEKNTDANFKFTLVNGSTDLYYLDTGCTLKELSDSIDGGLQYFKIYDKTSDKSYNDSNDNLENCVSLETAQVINVCDDSDQGTDDADMYFSSTDTDGTVTLYLKNDNGTLKLYYLLVGDKTPLDAPTISVDPSVLSTSATKATLTVTPADSYPEGVTYKLYRDGAYVIDFSGTTTTITSAGTYTVKAIPPADYADFKESPASNEAVVTDSRTPAVIYAKNGTVNGDSSTCKLGTTVAEAANSKSTVTVKDSSQPDYTTYDATSGSVVKVTTTMASGITDRYVHAFVVNGKKTYLATEGVADASGNKTYYAEFTLDSGAEKYEVTPIYYYNACKTEGEYIRFYVGASEMTGAFDWGNTISSYAYYYYYEGETRNQYESDGGWPGQPMMYDEAQQRYYALVPKEINGAKVSGLTVNNYGTDSVHAANFATTGNNVNKQTYDYDDFKIINESEYDIIRFDMKPRDVVENSSNKNKLTGVVESGNGSDADAELLSKYKETPSSIFTDIADKESTRWEPFLDNNGNNVSILGKAVVDSNVKVYIVSTALYKLTDRGDYMTKWFVFKETTNTDNTTTVEYVTSGCPSDFIPRTVGEDQTEEGVNTAAYKAVLANGCDTALATIVYEDVKDSRIDGRWYYAQSDQPVSAYVKYRTSDDNGQTYSELKANTAYASVNGDVSVTNPKHGMPIQVVASPLTGYIFDHWSIFDNNWNWVADVEDLGQSFETTLDAEMYYVANFYKAAEGQLVISHSKYLGDDAKGGLGYYRLEVQVYRNGAWRDITSGTGTGANGQSVSLEISSSTDTYIRIKLITETAGENTFRYWYTRSSDGMEIIEDPDGDMTHNGSSVTEPTGLSGTLTYTFETEVWKLFRDNTQIINQMNFYSDIAPMTKNYKLTYIYDDRFGNQKSYVVTGTHDDQYYVDNGTWAPNDALIYEKAPYIDDLYKDCTWTMTQCTSDGTDATLIAVQNNKKYTVDIYDSTGKAYDTYQLAINSYVKNNAGQFYVADATNADGKKFSYWAVYERIVDAKGNVVKGKEVARHFYRKYTLVVLDNYIIKPVYGEKVEDKAYISDPQYSREQTTNADGSVVKDKLYVDFMLAYMSSTGELISSDTNGTKYQTGILIEVDKTVKLNEGSSDYSKITFDSSRTDLEKIAKTTTTKNTYTYTNSDSTTSDRIVFNYRATNTNYNNMNRLEYFVYFNNTEANCSYVMKAYYYVIVDGKVILSDPVFFNLYEVGNSDPNTVTTTS